MDLQFTSKFKKQYKKLPKNIQNKFDERLTLLISGSEKDMLRIHPLKGTYSGYWSMNVTGDIRAIYKLSVDENIIIFALIGGHSELY